MAKSVKHGEGRGVGRGVGRGEGRSEGRGVGESEHGHEHESEHGDENENEHEHQHEHGVESENEKLAFLAALDDRNLREVAEVALNAREVFLTDEQRSLLSRLCARVNSSRRSVTEWFYLLARDAAGELLDSPAGGRFAHFAAMAEAEETVTMAMVRVPKLIRVAGRFDGVVANVVIPKAKGREATVLPMTLFVPREVGVRAALFMLQQYPMCFVETRRAGGAASV